MEGKIKDGKKIRRKRKRKMGMVYRHVCEPVLVTQTQVIDRRFHFPTSPV